MRRTDLLTNRPATPVIGTSVRSGWTRPAACAVHLRQRKTSAVGIITPTPRNSRAEWVLPQAESGIPEGVLASDVFLAFLSLVDALLIAWSLPQRLAPEQRNFSFDG
jgi:hypothetical protein